MIPSLVNAPIDASMTLTPANDDDAASPPVAAAADDPQPARKDRRRVQLDR